MSKHIGIVTNQFPALSETFIVNKVLGLVEAGMKITVCVGTSVSDNDYYRKNLSSEKIRIININSKLQITKNLLIHPVKAVHFFIRIKKNKGAFTSFKLLLKGFLLKLQRFDFIHFEFSGIGIAHLDLIEFYKPAKIFVSCRGTAEYVTPILNPTRKNELTKLFSMVDRIHCVSEDLSKEISKYRALPEKVFVNRPAIKRDFEKTVKEKKNKGTKKIILSVGRLTFQKGYIYALLAIRELIKTCPDIEYHIIGQGPDFAELKYFIESNDLQNVIFLHGALPNIEVLEHLSFADVFLLPSVCEGIANSVLEAMSHSIPVVTTRIGGIEEVIKDGKNGILVGSYDSLSIKSGLEKVLLNQELSLVLGKNAYKTIQEHFLIDRQIKAFLKEYK